MIKKEVKKYKQGNSYSFRINISKQDNLTGNVYILPPKEYESIKNENKQLNEKVVKQGKELIELYTEKENLIDSNRSLIKKRDENKELNEIIANKDKQIQSLNNLILNFENDEQVVENVSKIYEKSILDLHKQHDKTIEELNHQHTADIKELNKENIEQLKESYDKFNEELKKYITVNQLQNTALKQILELGFMDLIRNKHKKIAKDQIKELTEDKKVYELAPKK